jgi:predicted HAD superfamily Cof-like phosphohydrolase
MINEEFEQVKEFHKAFDVPVSETPVPLTAERAEHRAGFMLEEIQEFIDSQNIYDQTDAMIDLIYFALGTLVEMGVKPKKIFDIVHNANMSKLWEDGKVRYREGDNKVLKPPSWEDPFPKIKQVIDEL